MKTDFTWKIGGEAGYGIASAGLIFSKTCQRSGYFVFDFNEYPSLIRGGHNVFAARVSDEEIHSQIKTVDILVALNQNAVDFHKDELSNNAVIILNSDKSEAKNIGKKAKVFPIPLATMAKENGGKEVMMNNVALGATIAILDGDFEVLSKTIEESFSGLDKQTADLNIKVARAGFDFARDNFGKANFSMPKKKFQEKLLLTGSDAISLGAIRAGLKFFACYPMTPINAILAYIAKKAPEVGTVYIQPEDEISGINMAIGAALAGTRSMVASAGGGFSLMVEAYGLAGMTETPLVIIEGQRPGPATGLPTWGAQGDLRFVLHAAQDDFMRIVLAPGDAEECFWMTIEAFNLAEIYQTPVLIMIDKHLAESRKSSGKFDDSKVKIDRGLLVSSTENLSPENYKRYKITASGISPRVLPGTAGFAFVTNSDEHDEFGFSDEGSENRISQVEKRMRKFKDLEKKIPNPKIYGDKNAKITLVGWGSTKGVILETQKLLKEKGVKTSFLHLNYINPFPSQFVLNFLKAKKNVYMIEQNSTGQGAGLIREKTGIEIKNKILKYDGRPFFPEEIAAKIKKF